MQLGGLLCHLVGARGDAPLRRYKREVDSALTKKPIQLNVE
jgi:hypothetical protein